MPEKHFKANFFLHINTPPPYPKTTIHTLDILLDFANPHLPPSNRPPPHHHQHHQWFQTLEGTLKEKGGGGGGGGCPLMTDPPNPLTSPLTGMLLGLRGEHQEGWRWSLKLKNTCLLLKFILCHLKNF